MSDLDAIKSSQSASFKKRNPHIFGPAAEPGLRKAWDNGKVEILNHGGEDDDELEHIAALTANRKPAKKRIRQSNKPELNKLEGEYQRILQRTNPDAVAQSIRFKLSTGMHYTPDFFSFRQMTAWEVKGKKAWEDSLIKLRMAAKVWLYIRWVLVWKDERGQWQEQHVLP